MRQTTPWPAGTQSTTPQGTTPLPAGGHELPFYAPSVHDAFGPEQVTPAIVELSSTTPPPAPRPPLLRPQTSASTSTAPSTRHGTLPADRSFGSGVADARSREATPQRCLSSSLSGRFSGAATAQHRQQPLPGHSSMQPGGVWGLAPVPGTAPAREVMAHAVFEAAQAKLEAVQDVAQAKMQLAQAKLAVVHAHVAPQDGSTWMGLLEGFTNMWRAPQDGDPDNILYA